MSLITERLGVYLMENSHFDDVMSMSVSDFIHGAKATNQIIYYANVDETGMADPLLKKYAWLLLAMMKSFILQMQKSHQT